MSMTATRERPRRCIRKSIGDPADRVAWFADDIDAILTLKRQRNA